MTIASEMRFKISAQDAVWGLAYTDGIHLATARWCQHRVFNVIKLNTRRVQWPSARSPATNPDLRRFVLFDFRFPSDSRLIILSVEPNRGSFMSESEWSSLLPLPIGSHANHHAQLSLHLAGDASREDLEHFIHRLPE